MPDEMSITRSYSYARTLGFVPVFAFRVRWAGKPKETYLPSHKSDDLGNMTDYGTPAKWHIVT